MKALTQTFFGKGNINTLQAAMIVVLDIDYLCQDRPLNQGVTSKVLSSRSSEEDVSLLITKRKTKDSQQSERWGELQT